MLSKVYNIILNEKSLIITIPIALLILIILFPLSYIFKVKFGLLHSDRIGHFVGDDIINYLEKNKKKTSNTINIFYFARTPCNHYIAKLWSEKVIIMPKFIIRPFCLISRQFNIFQRFHFGFSEASDQDVNLVLENNPIFFDIESIEKQEGENILKKILQK